MSTGNTWIVCHLFLRFLFINLSVNLVFYITKITPAVQPAIRDYSSKRLNEGDASQPWFDSTSLLSLLQSHQWQGSFRAWAVLITCAAFIICVCFTRNEFADCEIPLKKIGLRRKNPIRMNLFKAIWNCGQIVQVCCPFPELPFRVLFQNFSRVFFQGSLSEFYREILVGLSFERGKQITFFITD